VSVDVNMSVGVSVDVDMSVDVSSTLQQAVGPVSCTFF
jgi:hypothetical protein